MLRLLVFSGMLFTLTVRADDDFPAALETDDPKVVDLYRACWDGKTDDVRELITSGAAVDGTMSKLRFTPLDAAAYKAHLDVLKELIDFHANINLPDAEGSTPLLHACSEGHTDCAIALINAGADVNLGSHWGRTPLMYAANKGDDATVQALIAHKVDLNAACDIGSAIVWAAADHYSTTVKALGDAGADPNLVPKKKDQLTALGYAARFNDTGLIDYLTGIKASVDLPDSFGMTPLQIAIGWNLPEAAADLVAHGANVNVADKDGMTPLMSAVHREEIGLVKALLEAKADPNAATPQGETALTLAGDRGDTDIVQLLKDAGAKRTDVHIIDVPTTAPNPSPRQAFALGVGAIYSQRDGVNLGVLGGDRTPGNAKGMLKGSWNITDKASLIKELNDLRDSGHHAAYFKAGTQLDPMTDDQFNQYLIAHADGANRIKAARDSYRKWKERTGLAWDMCRSANLVSYGFAAGYIDEGEAWDRLNAIARSAQAAFKSWQEMSDNFLDGREIWDGKRDPRFDACTQLLLTDPKSPWVKCPWDTAFPAAPAANPPAPTQP